MIASVFSLKKVKKITRICIFAVVFNLIPGVEHVQ